MFDKKYIQTTVQSEPSRIDVYEHRAPTDSSVKLLKEMEEAAQKSVLASLKVEGNLVKGKVFCLNRAATLAFELVTIIEVNGREFENTHVLDHRDVTRITMNNGAAMKAQLLNDWSQVLAHELIIQALEAQSDEFGLSVSKLLGIKG